MCLQLPFKCSNWGTRCYVPRQAIPRMGGRCFKRSVSGRLQAGLRHHQICWCCWAKLAAAGIVSYPTYQRWQIQRCWPLQTVIGQKCDFEYDPLLCPAASAAGAKMVLCFRTNWHGRWARQQHSSLIAVDRGGRLVGHRAYVGLICDNAKQLNGHFQIQCWCFFACSTLK